MLKFAYFVDIGGEYTSKYFMFGLLEYMVEYIFPSLEFGLLAIKYPPFMFSFFFVWSSSKAFFRKIFANSRNKVNFSISKLNEKHKAKGSQKWTNLFSYLLHTLRCIVKTKWTGGWLPNNNITNSLASTNVIFFPHFTMYCIVVYIQ